MSAPEQVHNNIETDPDFVEPGDNDSTLDAESLNESTASITSSILEYRSFQGRTYQASKTTEYWAPNDDKHLEGFEVAHAWMTKMLDDKLFLAPIGEHPQRILDVGTGSGIWAIDMADSYPGAEFIGTDISPTQPSWVPPNLTFQIDDAQLDWTFEPDSIDFIHVCYMQGAIDDWPKFYRQMFRCLKPGGWFQHMEPDIELQSNNPNITVDENHIYQRWAQLFYDAGDRINRTFKFSDSSIDNWARDAGFTGIVHNKFTIPYGAWAKGQKMKDIGRYTRFYLELSLDGFAVYPIGQILGWSLEEVQVLVAQMRSAVLNPKNMTKGDMHLVYGQKPKA